MIYINSKGAQEDIKDLNDFHLRAAYKKYVDNLNYTEWSDLGDETDYASAKLANQMIVTNLYQEMERRGLNKPEWMQQIERDFQLPSDQKKVKDLINKYFIQNGD